MSTQHPNLSFRYSNIYLLIFSLFLSACAAQSSYQLGSRAEELVHRAYEVAPQDPDYERARVALEAGSNQLGEARYGRATKSFQDAEAYATKVLNRSDPEYKHRALSKMNEQQDMASLKELQSKSGFSSPGGSGMSASPSLEQNKWGPAANKGAKVDRMELPANALAAYLAGKAAVPAEAEVKAPKGKVMIPSQKRGLRPKAKAPADDDLKTMADAALKQSSKKAATGTELVKAPAAAASKKPPMTEADIAKEVAVAQAKMPKIESDDAPVEKAKSSDSGQRRTRKKTKLNFAPKDDALRRAEMGELDTVGLHLIQNPSNTLLLVGSLGPDEGEELIERRFESIKTYLSNKGVPDDQVRLDSKRKVGSAAEFEMFLIEH